MCNIEVAKITNTLMNIMQIFLSPGNENTSQSVFTVNKAITFCFQKNAGTETAWYEIVFVIPPVMIFRDQLQFQTC